MTATRLARELDAREAKCADVVLSLPEMCPAHELRSDCCRQCTGRRHENRVPTTSTALVVTLQRRSVRRAPADVHPRIEVMVLRRSSLSATQLRVRRISAWRRSTFSLQSIPALQVLRERIAVVDALDVRTAAPG